MLQFPVIIFVHANRNPLARMAALRFSKILTRIGPNFGTDPMDIIINNNPERPLFELSAVTVLLSDRYVSRMTSERNGSKKKRTTITFAISDSTER